MKKIFKYEKIQDSSLPAYIRSILSKHLTKHSAFVFESYDSFILINFQNYSLKPKGNQLKKIFIFLDNDNLLIFIENSHLYKQFTQLFNDNPKKDNIELLRLFFINLIANDMEYIDKFEESITDTEDHALQNKTNDYLDQIIKFRKQLLHLKHYYNQLQVIFDGFLENENKLFDSESLRKLTIIHNRIDHLQLSVSSLRDYVTQMREAYQSQIDIEQNHIMKVFTLITAIFLPLTLMVGWYGMNFKHMYELNSPYSYPIFILISILVCISLVIYFKKKHWF